MSASSERRRERGESREERQRCVVLPDKPSQAEGDRETVEEDLRIQEMRERERESERAAAPREASTRERER